MKYYCNPLNVPYRYQFNADPRVPGIQICREAADPSMICFKGKYYLFASMQLSVWVSGDMVHWESYELPQNLPLYDYAPDVRVLGDYVYFSASKKGEICNFYRTKDILKGPYEEIDGTFDFWDPNLFIDDDGRVYFYWGCDSMTPIRGVELDPLTMHPIGEPTALIFGNAWERGFERVGEDHCKAPKSDEEIEQAAQYFLSKQTSGLIPREQIEQFLPMIKSMVSDRPYIEGAWMDKHDGKYYLQYAFAGTQYNIYGDGVLIGDSPLGPFTPADNNPYSYKPGGFLPGAGHGSTMIDQKQRMWHAATMRISKNHQFERRVGIWPAGFDEDGELVCDQRYGDWPLRVDECSGLWREPDWMLLSAGKNATASSCAVGYSPSNATEENVQTWWRAASAGTGEWLQIDLGKACDVRAIQINFADDGLDLPVPGEIRGTTQARYIDETVYCTRWILEGSLDGESYFKIEDKSEADTDLPHDFLLREEGIQVRYLKLTVLELPYHQAACVSGLRVFGLGHGGKPRAPEYTAKRISELDMRVEIREAEAVGYNVLWGSTPEKLYHSKMIFKDQTTIGALVKGREYYVRVDAFNESGITHGTVTKLQY